MEDNEITIERLELSNFISIKVKWNSISHFSNQNSLRYTERKKKKILKAKFTLKIKLSSFTNPHVILKLCEFLSSEGIQMSNIFFCVSQKKSSLTRRQMIQNFKNLDTSH